MDEMREAFEAWAQQPPMEFDIRRFGDNSAWPGNYRSYPVQCAWEAWEAACAIEREACAKVCESLVGGDRWSDNGTEAADAIRARGQQ